MQNENVYEIKIKIYDESDLYNPLDPDQQLLKDEIIDYVIRKYSEKKELMDTDVLHIISHTPVNEERVRNNIRTYLKQEEQIVLNEQHRTVLKQIWLFGIGILFIALWLLLSATTENIIVEVLSIIGSFATWEAANIWIVEAPGMRLKRRRLERLEKIEIRFSLDSDQPSF